MYVQELASIKQLSQMGSAQLAADLDYFCNVLAALGVALPQQLVTWQVCLLPTALATRLSAKAAASRSQCCPKCLSTIGLAG